MAEAVIFLVLVGFDWVSPGGSLSPCQLARALLPASLRLQKQKPSELWVREEGQILWATGLNQGLSVCSP